MTRAGSPGWIEGLASHGPARDALRFVGDPAAATTESILDYASLARVSESLARELDALGFERGDLLAVLAPPSPTGIALFHAMLDRGIAVLPLNARTTEREQRDAIERTGACGLLVPAVSHAFELERLERLVAKAAAALITFEALDAKDPLISRDRLLSRVHLGRDARPGPAVDASEAPRVAADTALVLMTSGTSGRPKAAEIGLPALVASAVASGRLVGSRASDRWLLCMPLFHIAGLSILVRAALVGAAVVAHPRFDPEWVAASLEYDGITRVSFVPTMLERVIGTRDGRPSPAGLELVLLGGASASRALLERARALRYPVAETYGLTEAASQVATRLPSADPRAGLTPLPGTELRIVDETGRSVAAGTEGTIEVRGPTLMTGYLADESATRAAFREGGLVTGDVGRLDPDGCLHVLDRRADLILSGGENVYPAEVEAILNEHVGVAEAAVFGIADRELGARPMAAVVMQAGSSFDGEALDRYCRARLARFKCPVAYVEYEELPRTSTGKLMRQRLREEGPSRVTRIEEPG